MSASRTTIKDDGLPSVHPGDVLRESFLIGTEVSLDEVSIGAGIARDRLERVLAGRERVDAEIDLRLGRYFGISEGVFLNLQTDYDLEEARRHAGSELDRIVRRAA